MQVFLVGSAFFSVSLNRTFCLSFFNVSQSSEISCDVLDLFLVGPDGNSSFFPGPLALLGSSP